MGRTASYRPPRRAAQGENPFQLDSGPPKIPLSDYIYTETRYRMLLLSDETRAEMLMKKAQDDVRGRWDLYRQMAAMHYDGPMDDADNGGNGHEG